MTAPLGSSEQPPESPSPPAAPSESEASRRAGRKASAEFWVSPKAALLCLPLLALILGGHAFYYAPFLSDDALISLRYADRFVDGLGLTWTDGERVEGYTDLLWVLLTATLHFFGFDLIFAARGLALAGCVAGALWVSLDPRTSKPSMERVVSGGLGLALCAPVAIWAVGALEHGFMVGVIAGALFFLVRASHAPGVSKEAWFGAFFLCLLVLLRADGAVLVFGIVLPTLFVRSSCALTRFLLWAVLPILAVIGQHLFRHGYYGQWVPNTALAKVAMNQERVLLGIHHVGTGLFALWPTLVAIALTSFAGFRQLRFLSFGPALSASLIWCAYLALVGGDIFPGWRQLLLGLVPLYFLLAQTTAAALEQVPEERSTIYSSLLLVACASLVTQSRDAENRRGKSERWEWAGASVGPALKRAFGEKRPLLAVDAAGALPFWSELPSLDMLGLNDSYLAHHPPASFGHGGIGHELGNGAYVLSRRPDLIAFNNAQGSRDPLFLSGREMILTDEFRKTYSLMRLRGVGIEPAIGEIYVRKDGPLGFHTSGEATLIPGYFFSQGEAHAGLSDDGTLEVKLEPGKTARLEGLELPPGRYRLELNATVSDLRLAVRCQGKTMAGAPSQDPIVAFSHGLPLSIHVESPSQPGALRGVRLEKVEDEPTLRCSSGPVRAMLDCLSIEKAENSAWDAPTNVVFSRSKLVIILPEASRAGAASLSVDNNDTYTIEFLGGGERRGSVVVEKRNNGGGLAVHQIEVPEIARSQSFDEIRIVGKDGDGAYSLGHLLLE